MGMSGRWFASESKAKQEKLLAENPDLRKIWDDKYGDRAVRQGARRMLKRGLARLAGLGPKPLDI